MATALCLGVLAAAPARAAPPRAAPAPAGLRLRLQLPEGAPIPFLEDLELHLGEMSADRLRLGQFDLGLDQLDLGAPRVGLALRASHLDLGVSAGRQLAGDGSAGLSLAAHLRLGAREGVNLTARYSYLLGRDRGSGGPLGPHGAVSIPVAPRLALTGEGGLLADGSALVTVGVNHLAVGDGGPGSWYLSAGLGLTFEKTATARGRRRVRVNDKWSAAPVAIFGVERRF